MVNQGVDAKQRILEAARELLAENSPDKITVRQVAELAGVATGAINYHFGSKDSLLQQAVGELMGNVAVQWYQPLAHPELDAVTRLRRLIKEVSDIALRYRQLSQFSISHSLLHGKLDVPQLIVPLLREIYGQSRSELEVKWLAFEFITALQIAFLREDEFRSFVGVDLGDDSQRDRALDLFIDILVKK